MSRFAGLSVLLATWSLLVALIFLPTVALAAPKFPPLTGRVVDNAEILSPAAEAKLTAELAALERQTGHQLVVATLPTLQGYEIEDYGYQLLRTWGIGRKGEDDGAILIVAPNEKKVRIEVGYGLEPVLTDALSSLIIHRAILPAFREGRYEDGVVAGAEQIVRQIGLPADQAQAAVAEAEAQKAAATDGGSDVSFVLPIVFIFIVLWLLSGVLRMFGVRRRFGGSGLWWLLPMILDGASRRGGGWSGGGFGGGGGFSGGGGSGGGGGASGSW
ncbi:TPM domain-containing protein [Phenylobacterium sp.]|uniref:TPM domain-containing protein n=1 Tax=Phenylobacterium sp. TaxID=1871053 RepID=UPI0025DFAEC6|nr:TPM domain-containing protein [Phenylobacterium sp.]